MNSKLTIKSLYALALAEGEGVGTAYEYYAKRLVMTPWMQGKPQPRKVLIAGLPEIYGCSLDFVHLACEYQTSLTIVDERPEKLEMLQQSITAAKAEGWFNDLNCKTARVSDINTLPEISGQFDLGLSSEVVQRIKPADRPDYLERLQSLVTQAAIFMPNAGNAGHTNISGLSGLHYHELTRLLSSSEATSGYIDMPPFPPGITRTEAQREKATSGKMENLAMKALEIYARLERFVPSAVRKRQSHIIYGLTTYASP